MKKVIKTGIELGIIFGVAKVSYAVVNVTCGAAFTYFGKKFKEWADELRTASVVHIDDELEDETDAD